MSAMPEPQPEDILATVAGIPAPPGALRVNAWVVDDRPPGALRVNGWFFDDRAPTHTVRRTVAGKEWTFGTWEPGAAMIAVMRTQTARVAFIEGRWCVSGVEQSDWHVLADVTEVMGAGRARQLATALFEAGQELGRITEADRRHTAKARMRVVQ